MDHHYSHLRKSFEFAKESTKNGNHPFGALLVINDQMVLHALNSVITENDVTRHAEMNLVSKASKIFSRTELASATLYTSTEPCAMCAGAIVWSGIKMVFFGCSAKNLGAIAKDPFATDCRIIFNLADENFSIEGPLLEEEALEIHHRFWT